MTPVNISGYRSLQQQELVNPPLECCEIVIWWKAYISEGVPKGCHARKTAHSRINCMMMHLLRKTSANSPKFWEVQDPQAWRNISHCNTSRTS